MKKVRTTKFASLALAFAAASVSGYAMGETSRAIEASPKFHTSQKSSPIKSAPPREKSDCDNNGIDDLDEFFPPDCFGTFTGNGDR